MGSKFPVNFNWEWRFSTEFLTQVFIAIYIRLGTHQEKYGYVTRRSYLW